MRVRIVCLSLLFSFGLCCAFSQASPDLVLVHANVVDIRSGSVQRDASVVISGSKLKAVAPGKSSSISIPVGARVVNAHGGYLIPGLWDMHVHSEGDKRALLLMLAAGITGVRDMGGEVHKLNEARRHIETGDWDGPRLLFAGPTLNGPPDESGSGVWILHTPDEARRAVVTLAGLRVDFIKVHDHLAREVYFAVAAAAKEKNLPFAGHVSASVTAREASDAGQASIEHFEFLPKECVPLLGDIAAGAKGVPKTCVNSSTRLS